MSAAQARGGASRAKSSRARASRARTAAELRRLEQLAPRFGEGLAGEKRAALARLRRARFADAATLTRWHELLLYLCALADERALRDEAEAALAELAGRADLRRLRSELADSGIAGTASTYPFFWPTADWLERRHGSRLVLAWDELEDEAPWLALLERFALWAETPGLDEWDFPLAEWIARLKGKAESDAQFLVRRVRALRLEPFLRQHLWEQLAPTLRLEPGPQTPSRTRSRWSGAPFVARTRPLRRERPDLRREALRPPLSVRAVSPREGARLVELAREAMVTRQRDLDAFMHGDARDVRVVDCGEGLCFAAIGVVPERRLLLESLYGFLTLQNGVPIGYVLASALWRSAEVAYNVFDTWRGGEAAWVYARALATIRALFGADSFSVPPYQLGHDNEEGLASGAWWFYQKLGLRPRDPATTRLMRAELARVRARPAHRSSRATLQALTAESMYLHLGEPRDEIVGLVPSSEVGLALSARIAARFGSDRERAAAVLAEEAAALVGLRGWKRLPRGERLGFERWAPLVCALPGVARWSAAERRELGAIARAKGGRRESDFVARFDEHGKLRGALLALAASAP